VAQIVHPEALEDDRRRSGWSIGQVAWRLGVSVREYRETTDPALVRAILRVKDGMGGDYWWVECGACNTCWQVPYYAAESVG
jgi:hypothetical protein